MNMLPVFSKGMFVWSIVRPAMDLNGHHSILVIDGSVYLHSSIFIDSLGFDNCMRLIFLWNGYFSLVLPIIGNNNGSVFIVVYRQVLFKFFSMLPSCLTRRTSSKARHLFAEVVLPQAGFFEKIVQLCAGAAQLYRAFGGVLSGGVYWN